MIYKLPVTLTPLNNKGSNSGVSSQHSWISFYYKSPWYIDGIFVQYKNALVYTIYQQTYNANLTVIYQDNITLNMVAFNCSDMKDPVAARDSLSPLVILISHKVLL